MATTPWILPGDEIVLDARPLLRLEARVVVIQAQFVASERPGDALARVAGAGVDDRAALPEPPEPVDEDTQSILVAAHLLDVVTEVGANDAGAHLFELATERAGNLPRRGRRRRGGHAEH